MKHRKQDIFDIELDEEELKISKALNEGKLKRVKNIKEELRFARKAASNYFRKDAQITLHKL